jgi:F-type H+-transporting ATPase subunit b
MPLTVLLAAAPAEGEKTNNFLIPNGTFWFEVICFVIILWILAKYAVPRISAMIEKRQQAIAQQFEDAKKAREDAEKARQEYQDALAETRREITRLREEASAERAQILEQARSEATAYRDEQVKVLEDRLATERQQILMSLRSEVGQLAFALSEKIVHSSLRDDERQRQLVDDFIAGIGEGVKAEAGATSGAAS